MDDKEMMTYLKEHYPHLYDIEQVIKQIQCTYKYGSISSLINIVEGIVNSGEIIIVNKKIYKKKYNNQYIDNPSEL